MTTEEAKQEIQQLVAKYEALSARAIKGYNEANTKDGFVRPLFEALGWDFSNLDEVEAEKTITPGRVDYLFKVHGVAKFCLEVKPLHVDINEERWIRQAIAYAYYKGVTWAVLTNFKTLRAFNAERETRDIKQIAFLNLSCESYLTDFHRLWLLSREAVASGDLDKEAVAYGRLPPRLPVEKRLYGQLIGWRETFFNEVYLYYKDKGFTWSQVDQWIQQLLNRLIFIRTAEDRGLIDRKLLAALHQWRGSDGKALLIDRLRDIFHEFARLYDSDLFPQLMDPWDSISVYNSSALADIIQGLYEVPGGLADWDFATIGSDVLGTVYEQYLGYVPALVKEEAKEAQQRLFPAEPHIGLTAKKEKRKEAGIYYTPPWVVDHIVKQTVGRFIEEHSYNDILNIKILDPACGSGSFLTRAYEELLNYHARQQNKSPADLEQWERTRILLRNIYGVDLDQQAVEIARLSLLLCSLSGQETLPSLANNIRQGNSLISGTEEELRRYFGDGWREKRPFNWDEEFDRIMSEGGFDVVIGNPPYVDVRRMDDMDKQFFLERYPTAYNRLDIFAVFLAKGIDLLRDAGFLGFIVPNTVLTSTSFAPLRRFFLNNCKICQVFNLGPGVFESSSVETVIIILQKEPNEKLRDENLIEILISIRGHLPGEVQRQTVAQSVFNLTKDNAFNISMTDLRRSFWRRIESESVPLGHLTDGCWNGINTGNAKKDLIANTPVDSRYKKVIDGRNIERYTIIPSGQFILYDRAILERSREERIFTAPEKIILRKIGKTLIAAYDREQYYSLINTTIILPKESSPINLKFLVALLNSQLLGQYYKDHFLGVQIKGAFLKQLPIRRIDFENPEDKKMHDDLVALVERMLELNKRLAPIRNTPCNERDELMREIERTDRQIDNLVYDLYGLTEEERKVVEEST